MSDNNSSTTEVSFQSQWADEMRPNFSIDAYLEKHLGPKYLPKDIVVPLTILYILIFLSGLIGNLCVCTVISKKNSMKTATNYYLFSLAVSDLLLLVFGLPNDLRLFWEQYPWVLGKTMCRARALISEMTNYASVLTIVAFTVERYVAICHPLLSQTTSSLQRVIKVIAANWIIAAITATPYAVLTSVYYIDFPPGSKHYIQESAFCMMPTDPNDNPHFRPLLCFSSLAFFFIPMTLIGILYIKIGITLRKSTIQATECSSLNNEAKLAARKAIFKMLVAVVIAFIICWAPFHAQRLLFVYAEARHWPTSLRKVNEILYFAGCLYYFNATINPILYNVMSAKYREAFREILCAHFPRFASVCPCTRAYRKRRTTTDNDLLTDGHAACSITDTCTLCDDSEALKEPCTLTLTLGYGGGANESEKSNCAIANGKRRVIDHMHASLRTPTSENKTNCLQIPACNENHHRKGSGTKKYRLLQHLRSRRRLEASCLGHPSTSSSAPTKKQMPSDDGPGESGKNSIRIPTFKVNGNEIETSL